MVDAGPKSCRALLSTVTGRGCVRPRLRQDRAMRVLAVCMVLMVTSCGGRGSGAAEPTANVGAYPGLRWVPADVSYVIAARRTADLVAVLRDLFDVTGLLTDADAETVAAAMRGSLGFDVLSVDGLAAVGVAVDGGAAMFSKGMSPTLAVQLDDASKMTATIDRLRSGGVAVQTRQEGGVEVFSYRGNPNLHVHWAIAEGWLWARFEIVADRDADDTWFTALRAARGALAAHADWKAALASGRRLPSGASEEPPVAGLVRMGPYADALARSGVSEACLALPRRAPRSFFAAAVTGPDGAMAIAFDLGAAARDLAALAQPALAGWATARHGAPVQAELTFDLVALGTAVAPCDGGEIARAQEQVGLRGLRGFVRALDLDKPDGVGAVHVDLVSRRPVAAVLDEIPGRSLLERKRRIGPYDGASISLPGVPDVAYVLVDVPKANPPRALFAAAVGLDLATVVGNGTASPSPQLAHFELVPGGLPAATWEGLMDLMGHSAEMRQRTVTRLQRWKSGQVDLVLDGSDLVLTVRTSRVGAPQRP
jgi:hypothetical protein